MNEGADGGRLATLARANAEVEETAPRFVEAINKTVAALDYRSANGLSSAELAAIMESTSQEREVEVYFVGVQGEGYDELTDAGCINRNADLPSELDAAMFIEDMAGEDVDSEVGRANVSRATKELAEKDGIMVDVPGPVWLWKTTERSWLKVANKMHDAGAWAFSLGRGGDSQSSGIAAGIAFTAVPGIARAIPSYSELFQVGIPSSSCWNSLE